MPTMTIQLGRLTLREDRVIAESSDNQGIRSITLKGQESRPRLSGVEVRAQREDILSLSGTFLQIVFTRQTTLSGYYSIDDSSGEIEDIGSDLVMFRWTINATRVGTVTEVDLESRLSGAQTRSNAFSAVGERTHAPSIAAYAYWAGSTAPSSVDRPNADGGNIRVYRSLVTTINPRWAINASGYAGGRARLKDGSGRERSGNQFRLDTSVSWPSWEINNGTTRVRPSNGTTTFDVGLWNGSAWEEVAWIVRFDNPWVNITSWDELSVLRNEFDCVAIRLLKSLSPVGRLHLDLTLRRGSRVAEIYMTTSFSTRLGIARATAAVGTQTSGYIVTNTDDANGNRSVLGSALTYTADSANCALEKSGTLTLDAMIGLVFNGGSAVSGDTAGALYAQYLGMPGEVVGGVRR